MKVITLEEHIESKLLTDEINKAIGAHFAKSK